MNETLPPGPRMPAALQTLGVWSRPTAFLERARARYGGRFTVRLLGQPPAVMISDPEEIKELFLAAPDVLHPGEGASILEPTVGRSSVILLDEGEHLEQRKLMLPAFHGERMQRLAALMTEVSDSEVESWPREEPIALHPRLQRLTLEIILRAVFGLQRGAQLDSLRELLTKVLAFGDSPLSLLPRPPRVLARFTALASFERLMAQVDDLIFELIERRRCDGDAHGDDVLALLLAAEHDDGSPMSARELRDELMTALVAGHETTASELSWAFERLSREPMVLERLRDELDGGDDDSYLVATINETLRHRPVLPNAEPRLVKKPIEIGGVRYAPGVVLMANAYLVQHDPAIYPDPYAFRPERFLEQAGERNGRATNTYTFIPFGGGRRRCLGASFAVLEMKIVLRAVLERCELLPVAARGERARRRSITISPGQGALLVLRDRPRAETVGAPLRSAGVAGMPTPA
jgi:cytochrome P450